MTRTDRFTSVLHASPTPMTVRQICEKAHIPAKESKFVSSGLSNEIKKGRVEKLEKVECPVTKHQSTAYRFLPGVLLKDPKTKAAKVVKTKAAKTVDPMPDPVMSGAKIKTKRGDVLPSLK